ncbi:MAG TPA: CBS domain-containing protein [Candidatus Lokiarchaeia archaeon]|nr:CBS domain-containing protein [Candidatus Lokiarchaeia archaeon]
MSSSKSGYKVRDLVIDDEYSTIDASATVVEAAQKMKEAGVPDLVILDGDEQAVVGIIADFDIVHEIVAEGKDPSSENVKAAMYTIEPVTLDTPVQDAFTRMRDLNVTVVPVVENGQLLGVCTIHDCWSYIPQEGVDRVGLIPVSNSRLAEFWLASICSIAAFILGVVFPLTGIFGYYSADKSQLLDLFKTAVIQGGSINFYLFEAHGTQFFISYFELASVAGPIWILMAIFGFALLASAILGIFSIFYSSYASLKNFQIGKFHQRAFPLATVVFIVLEWVIFAIALATATPVITFQVDVVGLISSIIAIGLIVLAVFRDYVFIQKTGGK